MFRIFLLMFIRIIFLVLLIGKLSVYCQSSVTGNEANLDGKLSEALEKAFLSQVQLFNLEDELASSGFTLNSTKISVAGRHQIPPSPLQRDLIKQLHDSQHVYEESARLLASLWRRNETQEYQNSIAEKASELINRRQKRQICPSQRPITCFRSRYRSADGSCNNLARPRW